MIDGKTKQTKETKDRLFQAFISLMENKSYEEIKIKMFLICQVFQDEHFTDILPIKMNC